MQGNWVVEIGWWLPRIEVTGDIAWRGQGPPRAVELIIIIIIIIIIKTCDMQHLQYQSL